MSILRRSILTVAQFGLIAVAVSACATAGSQLTPSTTTTTLMAGWEYRFKVDWSEAPEKGDTRRLRGYVISQYGQRAEPVRLLGQALDSSGNVVGQRIAWVLGGVPGFGRTYFEIARLPVADHYRVTVWDYSFPQSASVMAP